MSYYLAIDIGASGGRHMLGYLDNGVFVCEEVHRFTNGIVKKDGRLCWDLEAIFAEVLYGLRLCKEIGKIPCSVGIDTWGVDFVLLDQNASILGNTVSYRDNRTIGCDVLVEKCISEKELYSRTGIQKQPFNTIYQLMAVKEREEELLTKSSVMLLIPDYLHFRLCGVAKTEYTNATTTGLVNAFSKDWDDEIIAACGYPREIFADIVTPGTVLGELTPTLQKQLGFNCRVVLPATHDTGSAVIAVPALGENTLYISSGTWSLMGVERREPDCSLDGQKRNFTNEGGYNYRYRYLKNIMGLWMIQEVKRELASAYTYAQLCDLAERESISSLINCNDDRFLSPESMINEIRQACLESGQQLPKDAGELAAVVYNSLAACYGDTVEELEQLTGVLYPSINIVGGGSKADYLNKLTALHTKKTVYAGPTEATAIGNLIIQMIADNAIDNLTTAREYVKNSFEIREYNAF